MVRRVSESEINELRVDKINEDCIVIFKLLNWISFIILS